MMTTLIIRRKGGAGSGHHGHAGRPGKRGGSLPGTGLGHSDFMAEGYTAGGGEQQLDEYIKRLAENTGYTDPAKKVSKEEYDSMISKGAVPIDRSVSPGYAEASAFGDYKLSHGLYGSGIYFADKGGKRMATSGGAIINAAINPDARTVTSNKIWKSMNMDAESVRKKQIQYMKKVANKLTGGDIGTLIDGFRSGKYTKERKVADYYDSLLNGPLRNMGWYAMANGYKAIHVEDMGYWVVLDRSILSVPPIDITKEVYKGGPGSGHHGHRGIPGHRGGSLPGTGSGGRVWQGDQHPKADKRLSKLKTGDIGEALAMKALEEKFGARFSTLNEGINNAPIDMAGDHHAVEVKTGLASNGKSAQHWRATIGQPGKEEAALIKKMSSEEKRAHNQWKAEQILERKNTLLSEMATMAGTDIKPATVGVILSPDGTRGDVYFIPGFHLRLGWNQYATDEYHIGTYETN